MIEMILATIIGTGSISTNCKVGHSDKIISRQNIEIKHKYVVNNYVITENISPKKEGEDWITIKKDNKSITYFLKCGFKKKNIGILK